MLPLSRSLPPRHPHPPSTLTRGVLHAAAVPRVVEEQRVPWLGVRHQPAAGAHDHVPVGDEVTPLGVVVVALQDRTQHSTAHNTAQYRTHRRPLNKPSRLAGHNQVGSQSIDCGRCVCLCVCVWWGVSATACTGCVHMGLGVPRWPLAGICCCAPLTSTTIWLGLKPNRLMSR